MPDIGNIMAQLQGFVQNPVQFFLQRRMNLPEGALQNPQAAVQSLLNSGQMTQQQFNQLQSMAKQIQQNPQFAKMFGK